MLRFALLVHMMSVIAFVGIVFAGLLWQRVSERSGSQQVIAHTYQVLNHLDRTITPISVALIAITGVSLTRYAGLPIFETPWIYWSLIVWGISGILFAVKLFPVQKRLEQNAKETAPPAFPNETHVGLVTKWTFWAHTIFLLILIALVMMFLKPVLA